MRVVCLVSSSARPTCRLGRDCNGKPELRGIFALSDLQWKARKAAIFFVFCLLSFSGFSQFSNSWINFSQSYYKVAVAKDGIYRITYTDLQSANFPVGSVDPRLIKLYHRGTEQAIFIQGEADAIFDASDFIEFYGQKNDGTLDKNLYKPASAQPHSYYNLYSDTTAYFLTYSLIPPAGKRMDSFSEVNVTNIPKEVYHYNTRLVVPVNAYSGGNTVNSELQYSYFDQGEGWMGSSIQQNQSIDYGVDLLVNPEPSGGLPKLELMLVGRDLFPHSAQILVGTSTSSLRQVSNVNFFGFENPVTTIDLNWSDIRSDGKITVRISTGAATNNRPQLSVAYVKIIQPQTFDFTDETEKNIRLSANAYNKSYIEITNPTASARLWDISNTDNVSTVGSRIVGGIFNAIVSGTSSSRNLLFSSVTRSPISIQAISFRSIVPAAHNFLIITNKALMKSSGAYSNVVKAYGGYRASVVGGKYDTLTITVDQLYNQFNYGETSSLAIYEFMKYMVAQGNPKFLFIIGKGRDIYSYSAYQRSAPPANEMKDLVHTAGLPGSDMAFTAGLGGTTYEPKVATGRLPASTPAQVAAYLNKIIETEAAPIADIWKKQGLHLSGGIQSFELPLFKSYVDGFKAIAKDNYWGGNITSIAKQESNPVQIINVSDQVNKGTNLITFFGHSSPGTIDIDIGFVTDPIMGYNNPGKYPAFLINGCNAGSFFTNGTIFGEDWMLAANKGARNFIAHSSFGFTSTLRYYSELFYRIGFGDSVFIKKGIGEIQQEVARQYLLTNGSDIYAITQIQQMVLLGDPAVKLFGTNKPDYAVENSGIILASLDGQPVTSLSNSFGIKIIRKNIGATGNIAVPVRIIRTLSNNTSKTYDSTFSNLFYQDTVVFKLKREANGAGVNEFTVVIDPLNTIKEISKLNNTATLIATLPSNSTKNLFPAALAITNKQSVSLVFQATDLISSTRDFQIQIDTVNTFNSPYLKSQTISAKVLARLPITLLSKDSATYYWRTKFDKPIGSESKDWTTTSFSFIKNGVEGWGQLKFQQMIDNSVVGLLKDLPLQKINYLETTVPVSVATYGSNFPSPPPTSIKIDNIEYNIASQGQPCRNNTINLVAFNKNSVVPYAGIPFNFQDPRTCGRQPQLINSFLLSELETGLGDDLATYVDNIQESDSVVIFSIGNPGYQSWSANVKNKLANFGISLTQINALLNGEPLVILGKKGGTVGYAKVYRSTASPTDQQSLTISKTITGRYSNGVVKSGLIGPAKAWIQFIHQAVEIQASDVVSFSIYGQSLAGAETLLQDNISTNITLNFIDAKIYPYLRVEMKVSDDINLTAAQLRKWIIQYESVAEGILVYKSSLDLQTVPEGQNFTAQYGFVNYSDKIFSGELLVKSTVLTKQSGANLVSDFLISAPLPGDTSKFSLTIDSRAKSGLNDITVFVNPKILPEQYYDNNVLTLPDYLLVLPDKTPPLLEVRIDGRIILNNDFVSKNPTIEIELKDENPFLFKTDTTGIKFFLKRPCAIVGCTFERIYFKRSDVIWVPASASQNFLIQFKPINLAVGNYTLQVEAVDASGNKSGSKPYLVDFQVSDDVAIILRSVYPNPSVANFYFSFVLSGDALPTFYSLQIFSLDGRQMKEFTSKDFDIVNIGTNTLTWDARDSGGREVPNGIYIYQFSVTVGGKSSRQKGKLQLTK